MYVCVDASSFARCLCWHLYRLNSLINTVFDDKQSSKRARQVNIKDLTRKARKTVFIINPLYAKSCWVKVEFWVKVECWVKVKFWEHVEIYFKVKFWVKVTF